MESKSSQNPSQCSSSFTPPQNPESFIGSFVTLISNHGLRYEGVLYYLNIQDSTLGLQNVICYGTEGRNVKGSQIHPYNKVYNYIVFSGPDIKEIVVKPPTSLTRCSKYSHATKPPLPLMVLPNNRPVCKIHEKTPLISNEKLFKPQAATTDYNAFSVEGSVNDSFHIASQPQFHPGSNFYDPWFNYVHQYCMPYDALNQPPIYGAATLSNASEMMVAATQSFFTTFPPAPISIPQNYGGSDFEGMTKNFNQYSLWGNPAKKEEESAKPAYSIEGSSYMISRKPFEPIGRPFNAFGPIERPVKHTEVISNNNLQRRLQLQPPSSNFTTVYNTPF